MQMIEELIKMNLSVKMKSIKSFQDYYELKLCTLISVNGMDLV